MARKVYEEGHIAAIADKIREKTGINKTYKTSQMPEGVNEVYEVAFSVNEERLKELIQGSVTDAYVPDGTSNIKSYAYAECWYLSKINLPISVTQINKRAFYDCDSLEELILPKKLRDIREYAFGSCNKLSEVILPESLVTMSYAVFYACSNLKSVTFRSKPSMDVSFTPIFQYCDALADVYVPWGYGEVAGAPWGATNATIHYNYITDDAGLVYSNLDDSTYYKVTGYKGTDVTVVIPDTYDGLPVKIIARDALRDKKAVTGVSIGNNITTIDYASFMNCGIRSIIIPKSVTKIEGHALRTGWLTEVAFEENSQLISISSSAFYGTKISEITIPQGVDEIGDNVFKNCTNLTTVVFKGTPSTIAATIFNGCTALTDIYVPWAEGEVANAPWGAYGVTIHYNS